MILLSGKFRNKLLIIGLLLIAALFLYITAPFIFKGSTTPIFEIYNHDVKNHEVTVEIFDLNNKSIMRQTYILESESDLSQPRPLSLWLPQSKGDYLFKVTMDKRITNTVKINIPNRYTGVTIGLYSKNYESGENIPILIEKTEKL